MAALSRAPSVLVLSSLGLTVGGEDDTLISSHMQRGTPSSLIPVKEVHEKHVIVGIVFAANAIVKLTIIVMRKMSC